MFNFPSRKYDWPGRKSFLETGKLARQSYGAVWPPMAAPPWLSTVVVEKKPSRGSISSAERVNYQGQAFAAGNDPGRFISRGPSLEK